MFGSILAAVGMTADGLAEGMYAVRHRFSARAASVGYAIGAILGWVYHVVTPVTFTVESITVASDTVKKPPQILYVVALSAVPSIILGLFGLYSTFVRWLDPAVVAGVITGVGIILTRVGVKYLRERPAVAIASVVGGVLVYALTDNLVFVILASMAAGTAASYLLPQRFQPGAKEEQRDRELSKNQEKENDQGDKDGDDQETQDGAGKRSGWLGHGIHLIPFRWRDMVAPAVLIGAFSLFSRCAPALLSPTTG